MTWLRIFFQVFVALEKNQLIAHLVDKTHWVQLGFPNKTDRYRNVQVTAATANRYKYVDTGRRRRWWGQSTQSNCRYCKVDTRLPTKTTSHWTEAYLNFKSARKEQKLQLRWVCVRVCIFVANCSCACLCVCLLQLSALPRKPLYIVLFDLIFLSTQMINTFFSLSLSLQLLASLFT